MPPTNQPTIVIILKAIHRCSLDVISDNFTEYKQCICVCGLEDYRVYHGPQTLYDGGRHELGDVTL
jgi:hypothetical protein